MRNLNECRAEVFRRSENRIKARKRRRNRMLIACIPVILCVSAFGAFVLPEMVSIAPTDDPRPENAYEYMTGAMGTDVIAGLFAGTVTVSGNEISNFYSSAKDVQEILSLLDQIVAGRGTADGSEIKESVTCAQTTTICQESNAADGYKISINWSNGSCTEYLLKGALLIDQSTQEKFHMCEDVCFELKDALGISRY